MKLLYRSLLFLLLMSSWSCDDYYDTQHGKSDETPDKVASVEVTVKEGHLHFADAQSLESYISRFKNDFRQEDAVIESIPGFTSLAQMRREVTTRSSEDEMSEDEYRIHCAGELLLDPALEHVMDTSLTIGVGDRLYKITDKCTIMMDEELGKSSLSELADRFNPILFEQLGDEVYVNDDVTFINTFRESESEEELFEVSVDEEMETRALAPGVNLHGGYNVETYNWKNSSIFQKLMDSIKGKEVARMHDIDDKHRVYVSIFNVDYGFYKSSGITVKLQKKKKFLGIPVWTAIKADDMAVGFNHMGGVYTLLAPQSFSMFSNSGFGSFKRFEMAVDRVAYPMLGGCISNVPFVTNWTEKLALCIPKVVTDMVGMDHLEISNSLYDATAAGICAGMKSGLNQAFNVETKEIESLSAKSPRMALSVWGKSISKFSKEKPVFMGVQNYGKMSSKTVRFDISAGIHLSFSNRGFGVKSMAISEYVIDDLDAFAAAKHNGKWYGVRFTGTKEKW